MTSALNGLAVARMKFTTGGVIWMSTLHCRQATGVAHTTSGFAGLADAIDNYMDAAGLASLLNNSTQYTGMELQDLSPTLFPTIFRTSARTGTRGTSLTPTESALTITWGTGFLGRAFRGRSYMSGAVSGDLDNGGQDWAAAFASQWGTWMAGLLSAIASASPVNYTAVIYHRAAGKFGIPAADTVTNILTATGRTELASQKRRRK